MLHKGEDRKQGSAWRYRKENRAERIKVQVCRGAEGSSAQGSGIPLSVCSLCTLPFPVRFCSFPCCLGAVFLKINGELPKTVF